MLRISCGPRPPPHASQEIKNEFPALGSAVDRLVGVWADVAGHAAEASARSSGSSPATASVKLQELRDGKSVDGVAALRKKGFDLGSTVVQRGSDAIWKVSDVQIVGTGGYLVLMTSVETSGQDSMMTLKVSLGTFGEQYVKKAVTEAVAKHPHWPEKSPENSVMYLVNVAKCRIHMAFYHVGLNAVSKRAAEVFVKPARTVKAASVAGKGSIILVPDTLKILAVKDGDTVPEASPEVGLGSQSAVFGYRFFLAPTFNDDFVCPAWAVKTSPDQRVCNMAWAMVDVSSVEVLDWPGEVLIQVKFKSYLHIIITHHTYKPGLLVLNLLARAGLFTGALAKCLDVNHTLQKAKRHTVCSRARKVAKTRIREKGVIAQGTETSMMIPVLVNERQLAGGEELFWFREPQPKRSKLAPVTVGSLMPAAAKRAKTSA